MMLLAVLYVLEMYSSMTVSLKYVNFDITRLEISPYYTLVFTSKCVKKNKKISKCPLNHHTSQNLTKWKTSELLFFKCLLDLLQELFSTHSS